MSGTGNRGEAERQAIAESMVHGREEERGVDADAIVAELAVIKRLKSDCLENPDDKSSADELERRSVMMKGRLETLMQEDLGAVQDIMARGYRESAFDPVDLIEIGFDSSAKDLLSEKM